MFAPFRQLAACLGGHYRNGMEIFRCEGSFTGPEIWAGIPTGNDDDFAAPHQIPYRARKPAKAAVRPENHADNFCPDAVIGNGTLRAAKAQIRDRVRKLE